MSHNQKKQTVCKESKRGACTHPFLAGIRAPAKNIYICFCLASGKQRESQKSKNTITRGTNSGEILLRFALTNLYLDCGSAKASCFPSVAGIVCTLCTIARGCIPYGHRQCFSRIPMATCCFRLQPGLPWNDKNSFRVLQAIRLPLVGGLVPGGLDLELTSCPNHPTINPNLQLQSQAEASTVLPRNQASELHSAFFRQN